MLNPHERGVVAVSAALATRSPDRQREAFQEATLVEASLVEEAVLQSYLFLGYPAALNGFAVWREVSGRPPPMPDTTPSEAWPDRGQRVCQVVYGGQYHRLRDNIRDLHPDMERWMIAEGYGKVLGRPEMALALRELCIVAILAVLDAPRQLYSHLRGALNAGAAPHQLDQVLELAARVSEPAAAETAGRVWTDLKRRRGGAGGA